MSDVVIYVEGISKRYDLGEMADYRSLSSGLFKGFKRKADDTLLRTPQGSLPDVFSNNGAPVILDPPSEFSASSPAGYDRSKVLWALKDVSFEVPHGEIMGIIGRNGAGKSTLLKIMSGITEPTDGRMRISGRVGSLLEIGTGFHPELTGRENIYLNGAIIGMSRREINARFAEIVEFSEIGRFIDTPVKRYSSGMFTRLAFAVSAHLDPEILIIDEVLSVGDAAFQKKCMRKMTSLMKSGKTVLFVSHSMGTVAELCTHAVLLQEGQVLATGKTDQVIDRYLKVLGAHGESLRKTDASTASSRGRISQIAVCDSTGVPTTSFDMNQEIVVAITCELSSTFDDLQVSLVLQQLTSEVFLSYDTDGLSAPLFDRGPGTFTSSLRIPPKTLKAGQYTAEIGLSTKNEWLQIVERAIEFEIFELSEAVQNRGYRKGSRGLVVCPGTWTISSLGREMK